MTRIYGPPWPNSYGVTDDGTWLRGLSDLTTAQLAIGIDKCVKATNRWPPTLPEFRSMCLLAKLLAPYHRQFAGLPAPKTTREVIVEHRRKMLALVGLDTSRAEQFTEDA